MHCGQACSGVRLASCILNAVWLFCRHCCYCRKFVDILPLNDDWSPAYKLKVQEMVQARNAIRREMLGYAAQFGKKV